MVRITEDLVRKRSEHNECEISTLEEISLHQQDLEKIEYLDKWCRDLKILYLQSNIIPKIENVGRLKKLEYLNLALNNVERVENLEGCESLQKLDLTVNFVGELTSIENLKNLQHFKELFLTGNPCVDYEGYKTYVIGTLPHLKYLDGLEIEKSERIKAQQEYSQVYPLILKQQEQYRRKREKQKQEEEEKERKEKQRENSKAGFDGRWYTDINDGDKGGKKLSIEDKENKNSTDKDKEFWNEKVSYTPESRVKVHQHLEEARKKDNKEEVTPVKERTLITDDGRILNVNEAKVDFSIVDDEENNQYVLDVAVFKHMDTSLLDVDVQPKYVRVYLKGKVLQLAFDEDVNADSSTAQRASTTGHLVLTMPKAKAFVKPAVVQTNKQAKERTKKETEATQNPRLTHDKLEVDPSRSCGPDFGNIVKEKSPIPPLGGTHRTVKREERPNSEDFVDDPDVPPLE